MIWTVVYRDNDGKRSTIEVDTVDRNALFTELKRRGITAVSVKEGKVARARRSLCSRGEDQKLSRSLCWIVVGLIAIASAVVVCLWLSSNNKVLNSETPVPEKKIATNSTPHRIRAKNTDITEVMPTPPEKPKRFWQLPTTNGLTEAQQRVWKIKNRPPPGITNNTSLFEAKPKYAIFNHNSENTIAAYLTITPGQTLVGSPTYDKKFTADFLKSLEEPIIVSKDDDPETAALKRAMIETKIDLKARHDAGEDIGKILEQTHDELRQLSQYKQQIEDVLKETIHSGDLTEKDFDLALEAANKMLDEKGIAPMEFGPVSRNILLRHIKTEK